MKKISIGFVILHYKTYEQTKNCVESIIKNINIDDFIITIVDNYSNNGSVEKLEKMYVTNKKIIIIKSKENLGFARGNNLGIGWINNNYSVKYIAVLNNDTQLIDNNFYNLVEEEYKKSNFSLMGPKILLLDDKINPICTQDISLKKLKKLNRTLMRNIIIRYLHIEKITKKIKKIIKNNNAIVISNTLNPNDRYKNIILHGCFLIFSKNFFEKYDGFDDRTFLYREEELLFLRIKKAKLTSIYNPKITIFHEEDVSTNFAIPNERKRALFKLKNMYKSNNILIKEIKKMEE